jgi:hypothetical protein
LKKQREDCPHDGNLSTHFTIFVQKIPEFFFSKYISPYKHYRPNPILLAAFKLPTHYLANQEIPQMLTFL